MSGIGPALPPHLLAKRKRLQEDTVEDAPITTSGAKRSPSPTEGEKRRRVAGPAMPPASLDERPVEPVNAAEESDSDDEDGFGPSLPPGGADEVGDEQNEETNAARARSPLEAEKPRRDDWMMMPPEQDDLAARMDPTKIRARGFNTGKGAKGPKGTGADNSAWNETPEQRQKRLQDEVMGTAKTASPGPQSTGPSARSAREEAAAMKTRQQVEKARGPSLVEQHKGTKGPEAEDDPSKRSFDREKDMSTGMRIGHTQRKEMLNQAAGFSSKFSGGSYL
ncbi:hypothetical protein LTR36_003078 [Oleoguttula mirabilis]|uniref:DUF3752 domain-containing protein n=1 Tax=Oleoguttula mirabilis TaxID=1507867 RepID=A0AAV9JWL2_9PEZI|nr:hypothetical protein LTR36_003078 [Oleoguttula mirabilis]